jgi:hypothetical protein
MLGPLAGAAVFGALLAWGFLTGKMPSRYGPEPGRCGSPIGFWGLAMIYGIGCVGCLIWAAMMMI